MRARPIATLAAVAVAGAMAVALVGTARATVTATLAPRAAPDPADGPLVLAGRGRRPVWSFVLQATDRSGDRGSAVVEWTPRGRAICADGPIPLGARRTDVSITIESPEPVGGRAVATIGPSSDGCARATGTWRGIDGDLEDRSGGLELTVDAEQIVRVRLSG